MKNVGQQLDLFAGVLFTEEQEQMIAEYKERCAKNALYYKNQNERLEQLLLGAGFIKDVNFVNNFQIKTETREVTLGSDYRNNRFEVEVTHEVIEGDLRLKGFSFYNGNLDQKEFSISLEKDKVQCSAIQDQYRYIKPATMLEKLTQHNARQVENYEFYVKKNALKIKIIKKYKALYPNATVEMKQEWSKYSGTFDMLEVKFESGSYVQFQINTYQNKEIFYKKYDAQFEAMSIEEVLNKFNNQ
jgi:HD superfamily phosphohydrolase